MAVLLGNSKRKKEPCEPEFKKIFFTNFEQNVHGFENVNEKRCLSQTSMNVQCLFENSSTYITKMFNAYFQKTIDAYIHICFKKCLSHNTNVQCIFKNCSTHIFIVFSKCLVHNILKCSKEV